VKGESGDREVKFSMRTRLMGKGYDTDCVIPSEIMDIKKPTLGNAWVPTREGVCPSFFGREPNL